VTNQVLYRNQAPQRPEAVPVRRDRDGKPEEVSLTRPKDWWLRRSGPPTEQLFAAVMQLLSRSMQFCHARRPKVPAIPRVKATVGIGPRAEGGSD